MDNEPPLVLVKTWYDLLANGESPEAKERGEEMLLGAFGTPEAVAEYLKRNNIIE
jgi:hypothetical protein